MPSLVDRSVRYLLLSAAIVGVLNAAAGWWSLREFLSLRSLQQEKLQSEVAFEVEAQRWTALSEATVVSDEILFDAALRLRDLAFRSSTPGERANLGCAAYRALARISDREPRQPRAMVLQALFAQLFQISEQCTGASTVPIVEAALQAVTLQPRSTGVAYAAALVLVGAGRPADAFPLLRSVLHYTTDLEQPQREFIEGLLIEHRAVSQIVPARFPQVLNWSYRLRSGARVLWEEEAGQIAALQTAALNTAAEERAADKISEALFQQYVVDLLPVVANDSVRSKIDLTLMELCRARQERECATFFRARSDLRTLSIVRGIRPGDRKPQTGSLTDWGTERALALDEHHASGGFFAPEGEGVDLIVLKAKPQGGRQPNLSPASLVVYGSDDNLLWREVNLARVPQRIVVRSTVIYVLEPQETKFRFWKVHFNDNRRVRSFVEGMPELISAYGQTVRPDRGT